MSLTAEAPTRSAASAHLLSRVLQLLADEAPTAELDALLACARHDPSAAAPALADARRIRALLDHRDRREREAHALYGTARDLTSLQSSDAVLTALVDRSRRLLACDSSYIALVDGESGDAVMRVTAGTRTEGIRHIRQRAGFGVGGHVIGTGQPLATANYRTDPRVRRDPRVEEAVARDGIVSIAGVPIKRGTTVVGALFAANRRERTFEQAEISMLTSLAGHAAIVIENARLFEQVQASSAQLREANTRLRAQRAALERASTAHEQLMPMALTRVGLPEFTRTLARILGGTVALVASTGAVLSGARVGAGLRPEDLPTARPEQVRAAEVRAGAEIFGRLLFARAATGPDPDTDARTLERAAQTAALLMLMERRTSMIGHELRAELVEDLLAERPPDPATLRRRADRLGVHVLEQPHTVVVLAAPGLPRRALLAAATAHAARAGGIAGEHAGHPVLLLPGSTPATAARAAAAQLSVATGRTVTAGGAGPAGSPAETRRQHRAAGRCQRLLVALGRAGEGADIAELGVLGRVLENATPEHVHRLRERALGPLLRYDRDHEAQLVETADRYFAHSQNAQATADELGVHVNTVYQRLERIDHVLGGAGWRAPPSVLEMQLALQLHGSMRAEPQGRP
ncbi:GAF domain-containing protein [Pseudonocardia sp. MH-G8]|uniref:helix-turn-helix domain-containing protein n=1 Tax=Pseudonocardia sp. MH-G8 TaxID=1854588 RepID=UPI000BA0B706|nr:GAF domain-containing protein [Pseudonocardia sp. MH-G8]OZM80721.1 diguanylate phosphodiesterase [Pseudonocardia sp. MH-G8]